MCFFARDSPHNLVVNRTQAFLRECSAKYLPWLGIRGFCEKSSASCQCIHLVLWKTWVASIGCISCCVFACCCLLLLCFAAGDTPTLHTTLYSLMWGRHWRTKICFLAKLGKIARSNKKNTKVHSCCTLGWQNKRGPALVPGRGSGKTWNWDEPSK